MGKRIVVKRYNNVATRVLNIVWSHDNVWTIAR